MNRGDRLEDGVEQLANVLEVLEERLGVPVPLDDRALGLVVIQVDVVLQRSAVLRPHSLHGLSGKRLNSSTLP